MLQVNWVRHLEQQDQEERLNVRILARFVQSLLCLKLALVHSRHELGAQWIATTSSRSIRCSVYAAAFADAPSRRPRCRRCRCRHRRLQQRQRCAVAWNHGRRHRCLHPTQRHPRLFACACGLKCRIVRGWHRERTESGSCAAPCGPWPRCA